MRNITLITLGIWIGIGLAGCTSPSQMLIGPQGDMRRCAASGWGWAGAPMAHHAFSNCVEDYQKIGYLLAEEAGALGIQLAGQNGAVIVSIVSPDSAASHAGILVGDQIVKVNGQAVIDTAAARTLMFGKAGEIVNLTLHRAGSEMTISVQRAARISSN